MELHKERKGARKNKTSHKALPAMKNNQAGQALITSNEKALNKVIDKLKRKSDNRMALHMLAPDKYPPPTLPEMDDLMLQQVLFTGNLFYQREVNGAGVVGVSDFVCFAFTPALDFADVRIECNTAGTVLAAVDQATWNQHIHCDEISSTYTNYKYLGYKLDFKSGLNVVTERGGVHGVFALRPGTSLGSLAGKPIMTALTEQDPTARMVPIHEDLTAHWFSTDRNFYNWLETPATWDDQGWGNGPSVAYPRSNDIEHSNRIDIPYYVYLSYCPDNPQATQVYVNQYMRFLQKAGQVPPAITNYRLAYDKYRDSISAAITSKKAIDTTLLPPEAPAFLNNMIGNIKYMKSDGAKTADYKWYDKVAYALSGKKLKGLAKEVGSQLLKHAPELLEAAAMLL